MRLDCTIRYQALIWLLTFLSYTAYHMTRKVPSVVKSTLNPKVMFDTFGNAINPDEGWYPFSALLSST